MEKSLDSVQSRTCEVFDAFKQALETGDTADFLITVTEDFHFFVPLPLEDGTTNSKAKSGSRN